MKVWVLVVLVVMLLEVEGNSGEHGEYTLRTPKVLPKNTSGKNLSKGNLNHIFPVNGTI